MLDRKQYMSQTEVLKTYNVTVNGYKDLLMQHDIPVVAMDVDLGGCAVKTRYLLKSIIKNLNFERR